MVQDLCFAACGWREACCGVRQVGRSTFATFTQDPSRNDHHPPRRDKAAARRNHKAARRNRKAASSQQRQTCPSANCGQVQRGLWAQATESKQRPAVENPGPSTPISKGASSQVSFWRGPPKVKKRKSSKRLFLNLRRGPAKE